jgi:hypothetical protein
MATPAFMVVHMYLYGQFSALMLCGHLPKKGCGVLLLHGGCYGGNFVMGLWCD